MLFPKKVFYFPYVLFQYSEPICVSNYAVRVFADNNYPWYTLPLRAERCRESLALRSTHEVVMERERPE